MPVHKVQKRFMGGGNHAPPASKLFLPPDGVDPYPPMEQWLDEYNAKPTETFPEDYQSGLKLKNWYNYQEREMPPLFPDAEGSLRIWQEIHVERMLDNHPAHEVHPKDLPDYHYFPMIQNDVDNKFTGQISTLLQHEYHQDQSEIPRFHKNGMPRVPKQEQHWYVPLDSNGRCNWKAIIARWGADHPWFSTKGWNDRYFRHVYTDNVFVWRNSLKLINVNKPIYYRHRELGNYTRFWRLRRGTKLADPLLFVVFWFFLLGSIGAQHGTYRNLCWHDEPWNYDMHYMRYYRDKGAYHAPI